MFAKELFALLVVLGLVFSAPAGTPISACQDITSSGEYYLDTDLSGIYDDSSFCLRVSVTNVVLDCNGHSLAGAGSVNGIEIKAAGAPNITVKNCNVYNYDYGLYGDPKNATISNNIFRRNNYGIELQGSLNTLEYNNVSENSVDGAYISGDNNTIFGNRFFSNRGEGIGLNVKGNYNEISHNTAYGNYGAGFALSGSSNEVSYNTAYGNDWEQYQGGGFDLYGFYNNIHDNVAYDNTNGFYVEGPLPGGPLMAAPRTFGNTFTDNHAYDNLIGLNAIDYNGTYTDNLLEENLEADFLVGGDAWFGGALRGGSLRATEVSRNPAAMCDNIFDNMGSGGREIYFSNRTVTLTSGTYSEVMLCDADKSSVSGVTVSGSDSLDNNGMILFFTDNATIKSSVSKDNFMGFGFVKSNGTELNGCNSDGSGIGVASAYSKDLLVTTHTSANNRMDSNLLWDLLQVILGGGTLTGEPMMARERPDIGAGAILVYSPRATFSDSSFSGSTIGALFIMSDESTIEGGSAFNNDLLGYGYIDSYNGTTSGSIYGNDGNFYDIFGQSIPPAYEGLEFLPLGVGVFDFSTATLAGLPVTGGDLRVDPTGCSSYSYCEDLIGPGYVCDFDSGRCIEGTFENKYENARVFENNYGLVLLNKGHEVVEGCRIYDNNVLGIMDASNMDTRLVGKLGTSSIPVEPRTAITVRRTSMYRNGEQVFSTMSDLFERGGMEGWANAFSLMDRSLPKGVLEFELIEASYIYDMGALSRSSMFSGVPWSVNHSAVGTGASSVEFSVQDGAEAVYIVSDTTLPSVRAISVQDDDLGIDVTLHLQNEGVANKAAFLNKYFIIAAVGDDPALSALSATSEIALFQAHYGSTNGYDAGTMGLYSLSMYKQGWYCEEDIDCPSRDPPMRCYENMCVKPQCESDLDCMVHATPQYCVGYQCVTCRNDSDCIGDLTSCRDTDEGRRCASAFCIYDSECPTGQYCDITRARCAPEFLSGERSPSLIPLSEIANNEVALRAATPEGDVIVKGRWVPVPMQSNNVSERTITVQPLTQNDRTSFIEGFFGDIIPDGYLLYGDVYGLFATRTPGTGDEGEPIAYACQQDADCGECEFCSIDNDMCLPKEAAQCGVANRECREGYTCSQCSCVPPECTTDSQCGEGYKCLDYSCTEKPVEEKPPEEKPPEETPTHPVTPPVEEVTPEEPEPETPAYPLVTVEVPSVQAPKQPVSESQVEFQTQQMGLILLLLLGLVAAYLWFKLKGKKGKKGKG